MCRAYDPHITSVLGKWACGEGVEPAVRLEAMKVLLSYGHKKPRGKEKKEHSGSINLTMRMIHEGKPPGEK
jgi:hypothetical protein